MKEFLIACLAVFAALPPLSNAAQVSPAAVTGVVLDSTHAMLPRATVRLLDHSGGVVAAVFTDDQGRFRFHNLPDSRPSARYIVDASLTGFQNARVIARPGKELELVLSVTPVRESIVVTATRTKVPTSQLATSTTVIDRQEIADRQALSVAGLLRSVAGVTVVRNGGLGTVTSLFVRGGESNYTKIFLDGIPLNEPGGAFDFSNLTTENLDRVEVVRGPQSALFGSDAMDGVVQLFTARGQSENQWPHFSWSAEGGKNSTWSTQAAVTGAVGPFDYSLGWSHFSTANQTPNNAFRNSTASGNFGLALSPSTDLRVILRGDLGRTGTPGQTAFGPPDRDAFFHRGDAMAGVTLRNQTTSFWDQRLTYAFDQSRQVSRNLIADPQFTPQFQGRSAPFPFVDFPYDELNNTHRQHLSYQSNLTAGSPNGGFGEQTFTFAFDWDREMGLLGDRLSGDPLTRARRDNFGGTFQEQAVWKRVFLTNGMRIEDNGSFGVAVVPRSSLAYLLRQGAGMLGPTKLKFNFGLGINEPTFTESFSRSPFFLGNPNLAPERVRSFDFGVEQRAFRGRAKIELNWFDNRFRDQIAFETTSFNPYSGSFFNIGRSKAKGAEVVLDLAPRNDLRINAGYTYLDSQITRSTNPSSAVYQTGRPLLRRPRHSGSLEVFWDWRRLNVTSSTVFVGRRVDSDFMGFSPPLTSNPGYVEWDLAWSYRSSYRITYFGIVQNLLNQAYMDVLGYPALKFTYRAGVRLRL